MSNLEGSVIAGLKEAKTFGRLVFFVTDDPDQDDVTIVRAEDLPDWVKQSDILLRMTNGELVESTIEIEGAEAFIWFGALKIDGTLGRAGQCPSNYHDAQG